MLLSVVIPALRLHLLLSTTGASLTTPGGEDAESGAERSDGGEEQVMISTLREAARLLYVSGSRPHSEALGSALFSLVAGCALRGT